MSNLDGGNLEYLGVSYLPAQLGQSMRSDGTGSRGARPFSRLNENRIGVIGLFAMR